LFKDGTPYFFSCILFFDLAEANEEEVLNCGRDSAITQESAQNSSIRSLGAAGVFQIITVIY
jgi:hypothetical protein